MNIQELNLDTLLKPSTVAFVREYEREIQHKIEHLVPKMNEQIPPSHDDASIAITARFSETYQIWEKFFWARVATHYAVEKQTLEESLATAERDIMGLSSILHPL